MIALGAALVVALPLPQWQLCGPDGAPTGGVVVWAGASSADLAPVGVGACTRTAWIDPLGVEVVL